MSTSDPLAASSAEPGAMGGFLHNMLGGDSPEPGPAYTHTLWQPSIPLPFYGLLHVRCGCGKRFWGREQSATRRYRVHYWDVHITGAVASGALSINGARRMMGFADEPGPAFTVTTEDPGD